MLRIIGFLGNMIILIMFNISFFDGINHYEFFWYIIYILLTILLLINLYFVTGSNKVIPLYIKRKKLEQEIKIREAENKLKELQDKK